MMDKSKKAVIIISAVFILSVSTVINIYAESIWEGSAAMGRYGEFPMTGYYGASNSFPRNAFVEVENLESGKKARLIIVDRLSNSGLLMLVSNEAAQELGIYQNDISRVKVRLISSVGAERAVEYDDLAYSPDPDINPSAALTSPDELAYRNIDNSGTAAVSEVPETDEPDLVDVAAAEKPEEAELVYEPADEAESSALESEPVQTDNLAEAEVRMSGEEVPEIAGDTPEKPFDWPDTVIKEIEVEPEPLYLTMDDLEEGRPAPETGAAADNIAAPEPLSLWPDDVTPAQQMETPENEEAVITERPLADAVAADSAEAVSADIKDVPEAELELLFSGLAETKPAYIPDMSFKADVLPEVAAKTPEAGEYVTDATGYHSPGLGERPVTSGNLPAPEPYIPEKVIAALVGDSIFLADASPDSEGVKSSYLEVPEIETAGQPEERLMSSELAEAVPMSFNSEELIYADFPELPGNEDKYPIEVADGYVTPSAEDFDAHVTDFPVYTGAGEPVEIPASDEIAFSEAPSSDEDTADLPEMTEVPELADAAVTAEEAPSKDEPVTDDVDAAVPEYDENLEISLEPAEERPPELIEEEVSLAEAEAEPAAEETAARAEDEPVVASVETSRPAEAEAAEPEISDAAVIAEPSPAAVPEAPVFSLSVPDRVVMADRLEQKHHYLQLGAFKEKNSAINAAAKLEIGYPVTILTDRGGDSVRYKLLLGPLTEDESGAVLYNFRAGGYSDAFIRRIE